MSVLQTYNSEIPVSANTGKAVGSLGKNQLSHTPKYELNNFQLTHGRKTNNKKSKKWEIIAK